MVRQTLAGSSIGLVPLVQEVVEHEATTAEGFVQKRFLFSGRIEAKRKSFMMQQTITSMW